MPVSISCTGCGKMLTVRDELIGKRIKCPQCGARFTAAQAIAESRQKQSVGGIGHRIHISPTVIMVIVAVLLIPGGLLFWKLGPGKARQQFNEMLPKIDEDVKDVVDRALQAWLSQHEVFDPLHPHLAPKTLDVQYVFGYMPITVPTKLHFAGLTTQGLMVGDYFTHTGEIQVDVEIGGMATSGLLVRHGNKVIKVAGHVTNGEVIATMNGAPADIKWPEKPEDILNQLKAKGALKK